MSTDNTRLHRRSLQLARGIWLTLVILNLVIFFASLPAYIDLLQTPCVGLACGYQQLSPEQAATLEGIGLFPGVFMLLSVTPVFILLVVCLAVSMVIVWRRPDDRMAFIVALFLVTLSPSNVMFNVSASLQPIRAPTNQMGRLWVRCIHHLGSYRNCSVSAVPGGSFA